MPRYALKIQYDGTNYVGYQVQDNGLSIQEVLERALRRIAKVSSTTRVANTVSGRTDAGVHALGQVVHVDFPYEIPCEGLRRGLNSILDDSIRVVAVACVSNTFHARYDAISKTYRYIVDLNDFPNPFTRLYTLHHPYPIEITRIEEAIQAVKGTHDFTSFCSTKTQQEDKVRTVTEAAIVYQQDANQLIFTFSGNGFLYNMVRILVGTLLQIGDGIRPVSDMERLLKVRDRNLAGPTAKPEGLFLVEVVYPEDIFK